MRIAGALAVAVGLLGQLACFVYVPLTSGTTPVPGQRVAMDVTDAGRVALGGSIGPEIAQIEGRVVSSSGDEYELAVDAVRLLRGGEQVWQGERIQLRKEFVSRMYEKRLSKGRTAIASAGGVALVAIVAAKGIAGGGLGGDEGKLPVDTADSQRRPVRP
jgi:hypothetical protein